MIGLVWNCRGVSKKGMSRWMMELLRDYQVDFAGGPRNHQKKYDDTFLGKLTQVISLLGTGCLLLDIQVVCFVG